MPDSDTNAPTLHGASDRSEDSAERTHISAALAGQESLAEGTQVTNEAALDRLASARVEVTQVLVRPVEIPGDPKGLPFGRYQLLTELGRGGMGIVFKAWDTQLRRIVALKMVLPSVHERRGVIERFMREAQLAAKLRHPHIVGVLDVGNVGPQHYFTSDFIDGPSLFLAMKGQVPLRQRVTWVKAIADALHYAHGQGIVHRDVKPENILLDARENPYITDFGLAKEVDLGSTPGGPALTKSGAMLGTPAYMSPEQAAGHFEHVGPASDQYSLGVVLYHLLAGKLPFDETGLRVFLNAVIEQDPTPPSRLNPAVHRDIEAICLKALEKDPARRYPDMGAMTADLGRYLDGEPIQARPVSWMGRVWRKAKRNRTVAMLAVGLATALVGVLLMAFFYGVLPSLNAAAERRAEEQARTDRRREAEKLLTVARGSLSRGEYAAARASAARLVADYAGHFEHGEDLPIGEAHTVLGGAARGEGQARLALVEFYRAFEASVGRTGEAESLVAVGEQLAEMHEYAQSSRMFERALATGAAPRASFLARLGLAHATLVEGRFEEARRAFMGLQAAAEASQAELDEIARNVRFLTALSGTTRIRMPGFDAAPEGLSYVDLEGDRVTEVIGVTSGGKGVAVWRLEGTEGREIGRVQVLSEEPFRLWMTDALDLDGDGVKEIVAGGGSGDAATGTIVVIGFVEGKLEVLARAPLTGSINGSAFAVADLDGDGARELMVGTALYERGLRVYRFDRARHELLLGATLPLGGDSTLISTQDANGNGRPELWAFVGPWTTFGLLVFEADAKTNKLRMIAQAPISEWYGMARTPLPDGAFLVGAGWSDQAFNAVPSSVGRKEFAAKFRRPGIYDVRLSKEGGIAVSPVWVRKDPDLWTGSATAIPVLAKGATYVWALAPSDPPEPGGRPSPTTRIFEREGDDWRHLTWLSLPPSREMPIAHDIDGDGDTELFYIEQDPSRGEAVLRVYGMGRPEIICRELPGMEASSLEARRPRRAVPPALSAALETERAGLHDEALAAFRRVLSSQATEEDLEEAGLGVVRCGTALGTWEETAGEVTELVKRYPTMGPVFGRALLDALEEAGRWDLALASAVELMLSPVLTTAEVEEIRVRATLLRGLAEPGVAFDAQRDLAACDLLATTPLAMRMEGGGTFVFQGCSQGSRQVLIPLAYDCTNYRLEATIEVPRHEWANDLQIGLVAGDPAAVFVGAPWSLPGIDLPRAPVEHILWMAADGETAHPNRFWDLKFATGLGPVTSRVRSGVEVPLGPTEFRLEFAPHQRKLRFGAACLENASMQDTRVWLALCGSGRVAQAAYAAEVRLAGLKMRAGGRGTKLATHDARRAIDLLLLASGRWIQGRVEDARRFYDLAVQLGDEEATRESELVKRGLPSRFAAPAGQHEKHVATDARFWRGLLRAESEGPEAALEDLSAATSRDAARVEVLIATSVHALHGRPRLAEAVRAYLVQGSTPPLTPQELGEAVHLRWGFPAAQALLVGSGLRPVRRPVVLELPPDDGEETPVRPGDVLLSLDGVTLDGVSDFQRLVREARDRGAAKVALRVLRDEKPLEVEIAPGKVRFALGEGIRFETER